jgi:hypothetical protein
MSDSQDGTSPSLSTVELKTLRSMKGVFSALSCAAIFVSKTENWPAFHEWLKDNTPPDAVSQLHVEQTTPEDLRQMIEVTDRVLMIMDALDVPEDLSTLTS